MKTSIKRLGITSPKRLRRVWGAASYSMAFGGSIPGSEGREADRSPHLELQLRMSGATPLLNHTSSWDAEGQLVFTFSWKSNFEIKVLHQLK
jgi:hypothetical protein